jgi:hypothetical protein
LYENCKSSLSLQWLLPKLRRHRSRWSRVLTLKFDVAHVAAEAHDEELMLNETAAAARSTSLKLQCCRWRALALSLMMCKS